MMLGRTALVVAAMLLAGAPQGGGALPVSAVADECLPPPPGIEPGVPWAQRQLAPQRVWDLTRGAGVIVAVVDTGVDAQIPQLAGRVLAGVDVFGGNGGAANTDCYGHGTFIAGIIGAETASGTGFAGVAPAVTILPVRVAGDADDGTPDTLAKGIRAAVDGGAKVINVSATTIAPDPGIISAVEYAAAHDALIVAAAANRSQNSQNSQSAVVYPAALPSVLAVGATDMSGSLAAFSQPADYVDLAAPGVEVVSAGPRGPGHWQGSGTSYATAFVSGTAALVRAYRPELAAAQVKHRLQATADHPASKVPDPGVGWGVVNPVAAVSMVLQEEGPLIARPAASPPQVPHVASPDVMGPTVMMLGAGALVIFAGTVGLLAVLLPAGKRRRWRPARVAQIKSDS